MEWQKQHINLENVKEQYIDGEKFYQYTAIDEYSRLRYTWFTNAYDTYASSEFARRLVKYFPFKIKTIQTDNGFEFTNRLSWQAFLKSKKTMFENTLEEFEINKSNLPMEEDVLEYANSISEVSNEEIKNELLNYINSECI